MASSVEGESSSTPIESRKASSLLSFNDESIEKTFENPKPAPVVFRSTSHVSEPDAYEPPLPTLPHEYVEDGDDIYDRLSSRHKSILVAVMSFCALLAPLSSTSILSAMPQVAATYNTTGAIVDLSNAIYMAFMGVSPIVWGPLSQVFGRRPISVLTAIMFFLLSLATALSPNLATFFIFRSLSGFEGTAFILLGGACLGDIYRPTERATAMGWFMSGTLIGPTLGPVLGGIITALAGVAVLGMFFLVPETIHHKKIEDLEGYSRTEKAKAVLAMINPIRLVRLFRYWNQVMVAFASSALLWNMYSLLTPITYVLNPRFHLDSPMLSGLFYLAPSSGYVAGAFMGGRWADRTAKRWIKRRKGVRMAEDRLRSALPFLGILMPGSLLAYGWSVDKKVGGIPVPVIMLFIQGVGQQICYPSLNTYCLDVMPSGQGADAIAANYFVRYLVGCLATGVVLPIIDGVGVGWFQTISAALMMASALGVMATIRWGKRWRERVDARTGEASAADEQGAGGEGSKQSA